MNEVEQLAKEILAERRAKKLAKRNFFFILCLLAAIGIPFAGLCIAALVFIS